MINIRRATLCLTAAATAVASVVVAHSIAAVDAGETIEIQVAGKYGVPADATAAVLNIAAARAASSGHIIAWPCDETRPTAASLNYTTGPATSNATVVALDNDGKVCLWTSTTTDLIVDINGSFSNGSDLDTANPLRILDTRTGTPNIGETSVALQVGGQHGVPADASAAVLNIAAAQAIESGHIIAWPCSEARPTATSLNYATGPATSNATVVALDDSGKVCLWTSTTTDLIVDINGSFSNGSDLDTANPLRILDTRTGNPNIGETSVALQVGGQHGVPADASAAVLNIAAAQATESGHIIAWPCSEARPTATSLNYATGPATSNATVVALDESGKVCLWTSTTTDLVVDINGSFNQGSDLDTPNPQRILDTRTAIANRGATSVELQVGGQHGVPADASAAVLNIAAARAAANGYVVAWPCAQARPTAASLNYTVGTASSNGTVVALDNNGKVCLWTSTTTDLVVDINGFFSRQSNLDTVNPQRILDTRSTSTSTPSTPSDSGNNDSGSNDSGATNPGPTSNPDTRSAAFAATFDGNSGLDAFDRGVWHRDDVLVGSQSWNGDHDLSCGGPDTQRTISRNSPSQSFYTCKDHLMTSVGDASGYSMAWLSPKQTFNGATTVSVDVNSTFLGVRQWWEIGLVPVGYQSPQPDCPLCTGKHTAIGNRLDELPAGGIVFGPLGGGGAPMVNYEKVTRDHVCRTPGPLDSEGCNSKPIRRTWSLTDNQNGTVTLQFMDQKWTTNGSFPQGDWKLVIKDHNYTPSKDCNGACVGFTWHWDNIIVR